MSRGKRRHRHPARRTAPGITPVANRRPSRRTWLAAALIALVVLLAAGAALLKLRADAGPELPRAAIIDQLALTDPNPALIEKSRQLLVDGGYAVDYYPSDRVTVDLYRRLPALGYQLVIIRGHSSGETQKVDPATQAVTQEPLVSLFTSEIYSPQLHVEDQRARRLDVVRIARRFADGSFGPGVQVADPPADRYFGITPAFIDTAKGRFKGSAVLLMGCDAANTDGMAAALISKGAAAVVGWDAPVTAGHTDDALAHILQHLIVDQATLGEAVARTMSDIGPDASFGAKLVAYPKS